MLLSEHQRRLDTIAAGERVLLRREQQVAIREEVLREALRAGSGGGLGGVTSQWEQEIDRMVSAAAARIPPPISVSAFVHSLEDRAVELEVMYVALEKKDQHLEEERRLLQQRQAQLAQKEAYLTQWMQSMEASLQAMCEQEDALASQARRRQEGEAELLVWTHQLRDKEDTLTNREQIVAAKLKQATARERHLKDEQAALERRAKEAAEANAARSEPSGVDVSATDSDASVNQRSAPLDGFSAKLRGMRGVPEAVAPSTTREPSLLDAALGGEPQSNQPLAQMQHVRPPAFDTHPAIGGFGQGSKYEREARDVTAQPPAPIFTPHYGDEQSRIAGGPLSMPPVGMHSQEDGAGDSFYTRRGIYEYGNTNGFDGIMGEGSGHFSQVSDQHYYAASNYPVSP